jgi:hypothetical protein
MAAGGTAALPMRVLSARKQNQDPFAGRPQKTTIASDNPSYRDQLIVQ